MSSLITTLSESTTTTTTTEQLIILKDVISSCIDLATSVNTDINLKTKSIDIYETWIDSFFTTNVTSFFNVTTKNMIAIIVPAIGTYDLPSLGSGKAHKVEIFSNRRLSSDQNRELTANDFVVLSTTVASLYNITTTDTIHKREMTMTSNPIRMMYNCHSDSLMVRFILQTFTYNDYDDVISTKSFETNCTYEITTQNIYTCNYNDNSTYQLRVNCDGNVNGVIKTSCPSRKRIPTCNVMTDNHHCTLQSYNSSMIECLCNVCDGSSRRKLLSTTSDITQISAMLTYVFGIF